ncbi:MAG: hypothetical protein ACE5E7_01640 [Anaerolineae bacterium]
MASFIKRGTLLLFVALIGAGILIFCLIAFIVLSFSLGYAHPTDEEMIANYAEHKPDFEQLALTLTTETEIRIIFPKDGKCQFEKRKLNDDELSEKCNQYIRAFNLLGLDWTYSGDEPIWLPVSSSGLSVSGSSKGYFFSSIPPKRIVSNTDNWNGFSIVYRHIEGNWYIFYERS